MFGRENPVLQRELLVNLRMPRAFVLLFVFQALLGGVVYFAWPQESRLDLTENPASTRKLVDLFFLGQYILASLMAPSFASGTITGEKERKTYEMLLASPLQPTSIVWGKLFASLAHLGVLIFASLPIVMLCLPLGGVSIYEVFAAYLGLILSVATFGMISVTCSCIFNRTVASLMVSYLLILPLALVGALLWQSLEGETRITMMLVVVPGVAAAICIALFYITSERILRPPDVGSEGTDVVDLEEEAREAVGLVIQPDQFPDKLFAPPKRTKLMKDGANPVYDKEIHSEIFSQGTLMLRVVIQVSMILAIPLMAWFLYFIKPLAYLYIGYVVLFNILVGPVFSAGSITSERERQTLDLLLTTTVSPWQILWGKLVAGLRVSSVLTFFLTWPLFLAALMSPEFWKNPLAVVAYFLIIALTCVTTAMLALFCSTLAKKTSISLMTTYIIISLLFFVPMALSFFANTFFPNHPNTRFVNIATISSPFATAERVPLILQETSDEDGGRAKKFSRPAFGEPSILGTRPQDWQHFCGYTVFTIGLNLLIFAAMIWMFNSRWRVSSG